MSKRLLICVVLVTGLIPPTAHAGEPSASERGDAEAIAFRFCGFVRGSRELNDLIALATPELIAIVRDAEARNQEIAAAHPGDRPPLGGEVPYTGYQDHAPLCEAGEAIKSAIGLQIDVRFDFPDQPGAGWTDRLLLVSQNGAWLVDDVRYASPDYRHGLREQLVAVFRR